MSKKDSAFFIGLWTIVNTLAVVLLSYGIILVLGLLNALFGIIPFIDSFSYSPSAVFLPLFLAIIFGWILGKGQYFVLKEYITQVKIPHWKRATLAGCLLGSIIGIIVGIQFPEFGVPFTITLGTIIGLFQWFILRSQIAKAEWWIVANALGWGIGYSKIMTDAIVLGRESSISSIVLAGFLFGLITGLTLIGLLLYTGQKRAVAAS